MRTAWLPVLGLLVLAPVCAEYLWGYDDSTGHPATLVGNLVVFSPLYGAPAVLIREAARRYGLGWPGLLLLAAAFGVVEAGIVDQSMWSTDYRDIPYWQDMSVPTYLAPIGLSIYLAVSFVGGHVILSIGSPVAVVETLTRGVGTSRGSVRSRPSSWRCSTWARVPWCWWTPTRPGRRPRPRVSCWGRRWSRSGSS